MSQAQKSDDTTDRKLNSVHVRLSEFFRQNFPTFFNPSSPDETIEDTNERSMFSKLKNIPRTYLFSVGLFLLISISIFLLIKKKNKTQIVDSVFSQLEKDGVKISVKEKEVMKKSFEKELDAFKNAKLNKKQKGGTRKKGRVKKGISTKFSSRRPAKMTRKSTGKKMIGGSGTVFFISLLLNVAAVLSSLYLLFYSYFELRSKYKLTVVYSICGAIGASSVFLAAANRVIMIVVKILNIFSGQYFVGGSNSPEKEKSYFKFFDNAKKKTETFKSISYFIQLFPEKYHEKVRSLLKKLNIKHEV